LLKVLQHRLNLSALLHLILLVVLRLLRLAITFLRLDRLLLRRRQLLIVVAQEVLALLLLLLLLELGL